MTEHLIERLQQWPSCPAGSDPFASTYVAPLMKEAAAEIERLRECIVKADLQIGDGHVGNALQTLEIALDGEPPHAR